MSLWKIISIGNSEGSIFFDEKRKTLRPGCGETEINIDDIGVKEFVFDSGLGKISDSEDSFLFLFTEVCPFTENFKLKAKFTVLPSDHIPDFQTGYGIAVVDTVISKNRSSRFRNQLEVGRFRTSGGFQHASGVRVVSGYTDKNALDQFGRILDSSRRFGNQKDMDAIEPGDISVFLLEKNDEGFILSENDETVFFPGHDFLCRQEEKYFYAGFFIAGKVTVKVSEIQFSKSTGKIGNVPEGYLKSQVMDYPYERDLIPFCMGIDEFLEEFCERCKENEYRIQKGILKLTRGILIPRDKKKIRLIGSGETILDGLEIKEKIPLLTVLGSDCELEGITFQNSKSCGVHICGNHNTVKDCEAMKNGDTGFLICSFPGEPKEAWPCDNKIINCVSHDNCDTAFCNADGFGAKLGVGPENELIKCVAHHNVDDGFDLYTKAYIGYIAPVKLTDCTAYRNGLLSDGSFSRKYSGSGFKLGGENIGVKHILTRCRAYKNNGPGINRNSNPFPVLVKCWEWSNNMGRGVVWRSKAMCRRIFSKSYVKKSQIPDVQNRKNLMFLIPSLSCGGAERVTVHLANALCEKYNVSIIYYSAREKTYDTKTAINKILLDRKRPDRFFAIRVIRKLLRFFGWNNGFDRLCDKIRNMFFISCIQKKVEDLNIDTVISMLDYPNMVNAKLRVRHKIMSERNDPSAKGEAYFSLEKASFSKADAVVFQTERVKEMFDEEIRRKGHVIGNPVSIPFSAGPAMPGKIVNVGRLHCQKNQKILIEAFAGFHKTHPSYRLYLYGQGEMESELKALKDTLHLENFVFFEGYHEDIYEQIKDAEFFVLSSDYEGSSNSLMEALAMGIPCISTDCTGSAELITDGENGLLVPVGDKTALKKAMEKMADDPELRSKFAEKSLIRSRKYGIGEIVKQWEELLQKEDIYAVSKAR